MTAGTGTYKLSPYKRMQSDRSKLAALPPGEEEKH